MCERAEQLDPVLDLVDRVARVADADGVADAVGEQGAEGGDRSDRAGLPGAGVRDAEVERVVETLGDLGVGVDHQASVHGLRADRDVVEVAGLEDVEVLLEFGDHDREQVAGAVASK